MFKLVAILFAIVNGAPSDKPSTEWISYEKDTFPTVEACADFAKSDDGKAVIQAMAKIAAEHEKAMRPACIKDAKSQEQDDSL